MYIYITLTEYLKPLDKYVLCIVPPRLITMVILTLNLAELLLVVQLNLYIVFRKQFLELMNFLPYSRLIIITIYHTWNSSNSNTNDILDYNS